MERLSKAIKLSETAALREIDSFFANSVGFCGLDKKDTRSHVFNVTLLWKYVTLQARPTLFGLQPQKTLEPAFLLGKDKDMAIPRLYPAIGRNS